MTHQVAAHRDAKLGGAALATRMRAVLAQAATSRLLLAFGLALALCYTTSHVDLTAPNERSRLYLTVALFEQHSFAIDQVRAHFGPVFDEATFAGHFFTDKAPGASLLALVPYAFVRLFVGSGAMTLPLLLGIGRLAVMVPVGIAAFFCFEALCTALRFGRAATRFASLSYLLGTAAFHYSAAFFGHQIVATALLGALLLIVKQQSHRSATVRLVAAGAMAGLAGLTEYQASIGVVGLCASVVALSSGRRLLSLATFAFGGLPFALFLAYYHHACFGGPFELSYHHLSQVGLAEVHRQGIGGVSTPTYAGLVGALFSMHRGLFATTPHLLLSFSGVSCFARRGHGALALCLAVTALGYLGFVASSATWEAGWGYGSRLLIPALPILSLFVAAALDCASAAALWGFAWSALLVSVASFQAVTALFPEPPIELRNPWLDVVLPLASSRVVAPNLGSLLLGLRGGLSVLPLLVLLVALFGTALRASRAVFSRRWFVALLAVPALWGLLVHAQGPSRTVQQRADFVGFAQALYAGSFPLR